MMKKHFAHLEVNSIRLSQNIWSNRQSDAPLLIARLFRQQLGDVRRDPPRIFTLTFGHLAVDLYQCHPIAHRVRISNGRRRRRKA
jgi:hypothetical protein